MKMTYAAFALALLTLGACSTTTPYQVAGDGRYGYSEQQIEDRRWRVSFAGNSLTDRKTVETYLLYRAAELTFQEGYQHFRVIQRQTDEDSDYIATGFSRSPYYSGFHCRYAFYGAYGPYGYPRHPRAFDPFGYGFGAPDYREIVRYEASAEIVMGQGDKPEDDPAFFNASEVLENLAGQIERPDA